ncbi:MAG TPA: DUF1476 domain-containing protein [Alphaproteobacteria bacterium]|nr:DUF1476 domain-containing protein [Alphaproteobacteria bacterium]
MSGIFDDREKQFEGKYKHDEELRFKVTVRRNKLVGLWAAAEMGLTGGGAEAYAKGLVERAISSPGDAVLVKKIHADFAAKKVEMSEHRIRNHLETCHAEAAQQIAREVK